MVPCVAEISRVSVRSHDLNDEIYNDKSINPNKVVVNSIHVNVTIELDINTIKTNRELVNGYNSSVDLTVMVSY